MGLTINYFIVKYQEKARTRYMVYSYITILVYALLNTDTSRINIIIPIIIFVLIVNRIFGRKGKILLIIVGSFLITVITSITIYKSAWLFKGDTHNIIDVAEVLTTQIQEYTSGIRPVAQGIEAIERYKSNITFRTFFNDIFGSVPVVNKIFDSEDRINVYYNLYIFGANTNKTTQIIPLVVISKAYFSLPLCWLLTSIAIILMMYFEGKYNEYKSNYIYSYMITYISFIFASSVYSNTQIIIGRIFTRVLPVILILYLNNKTITRKESYGKR